MAKMGRPKNDTVKKWRTRAWYYKLEKLLQVDSPFRVAKSLGLLGSDKGSKFRQYRTGEASPDATSAKLIYKALIKKVAKDDKKVSIQKCAQVFSYLRHPIWEALSGKISAQAGEVGLEEVVSHEDYTTEGGKVCMLGGEPFAKIVEAPEVHSIMKTESELVRVEPENLHHLLVSADLGSPQEILILVLANDIETYRNMDYPTHEIFESLCENIKKANDVLASDFYITADEIIEYISLLKPMDDLIEIEVPEHLRLKES